MTIKSGPVELAFPGWVKVPTYHNKVPGESWVVDASRYRGTEDGVVSSVDQLARLSRVPRCRCIIRFDCPLERRVRIKRWWMPWQGWDAHQQGWDAHQQATRCVVI